MSLLIKAVFKATIGLLAKKGRDEAAERLTEGDVTDQKFRGLIMREIHELKTNLEGLARRDLLAAVDYFEAGLRYLYEAIDGESKAEGGALKVEETERIGEESLEEASSFPSLTCAVKTVSLAKGLRKMELNVLDETTKRSLYQAKERFKMAREKATDTCNNEALSIFDRITAIRYRVMATILETAVEAVRCANELSFLSLRSALRGALPECEQCLEKLHSLPAVQNSLKVELDKGLRFSKDERREIISAVFQVNHAIYDVMQIVGRNAHLWIWPFVDTGEDKIDPLRDSRVTKVMHKLGREHFCLKLWTFGQEGEEEHKLKGPTGIVTNTHDEFIISDHGDGKVKVFDSSGKYLSALCPQADDPEAHVFLADVTVDAIGNIFVLTRLQKPGVFECEVRVFGRNDGLHYKFLLTEGDWAWRLNVNSDSNKVLILRSAFGGKNVIDIHKINGRFVIRFGEEVLNYATDITATNDNRVMVVEKSCVHVFTENGEHLFKINLEGSFCFPKITFHWPSEYAVVAGDEAGTNNLRFLIYTKDGDFVRSIRLDEERIDWLGGITVTVDGRIVVAFKDVRRANKVLIL